MNHIIILLLLFLLPMVTLDIHFAPSPRLTFITSLLAILNVCVYIIYIHIHMYIYMSWLGTICCLLQLLSPFLVCVIIILYFVYYIFIDLLHARHECTYLNLSQQSCRQQICHSQSTRFRETFWTILCTHTHEHLKSLRFIN